MPFFHSLRSFPPIYNKERKKIVIREEQQHKKTLHRQMKSSSPKTRQISFENRDNHRKQKTNWNKNCIFANQTSKEDKSYATQTRFDSNKTEPQRQFYLYRCLRDAQNKITLIAYAKILIIPSFSCRYPSVWSICRANQCSPRYHW